MPLGPQGTTNGPSLLRRAKARLLTMQRHAIEFRCDVCRRLVDEDTRARARRAWQPLIICDWCLREADFQLTQPRQALVLAAT